MGGTQPGEADVSRSFLVGRILLVLVPLDGFPLRKLASHCRGNGGVKEIIGAQFGRGIATNTVTLFGLV